ncbi:MAG: hypothetical protein V7K26_04355 [Nostoc sp.]|uniref:hypothetical protein n=1 Tax=Nostoc sp. TaxID=1180 RepID=UPI002FF3E260
MAAPTPRAIAYLRHVDFLEYCTKKLGKLLNSVYREMMPDCAIAVTKTVATKPLSSGAGVYYAAYINNSTSVHGKNNLTT